LPKSSSKLSKVGVRQIFGLIGDSPNPLADAIRNCEIQWIGARHEEGAALAAAGQAKLTGSLGVCAGTTQQPLDSRSSATSFERPTTPGFYIERARPGRPSKDRSPTTNFQRQAGRAGTNCKASRFVQLRDLEET
jgi:hypothetical protein